MSEEQKDSQDLVSIADYYKELEQKEKISL
jgi:hypothetical protein